MLVVVFLTVVVTGLVTCGLTLTWVAWYLARDAASPGWHEAAAQQFLDEVREWVGATR